ncbi:hypothetical protein [Streptomyces agglomeratus]|uniref:hypothetical protein n=1 Tax=Streptomyces agglomeratus TaxID=285458 RepID=UPI00159F151E|nr:hypothetical protein [Streptomyces agglomeratus]
MSSKKRLEKALRTAHREAVRELQTGDSLVDYIKLLYEMDQDAKLAAKMRKDGDAK